MGCLGMTTDDWGLPGMEWDEKGLLEWLGVIKDDKG